MSKRIFWLIVAFPILGLLAIIGFVVIDRPPKISLGEIAGTVVGSLSGSSCQEGALFSVPPINPEELVAITPLGNLNPPDHTLPTDHIYLTVKTTNEIVPGAARTVVSPGEITLSRITHQRVLKDGAVFSDDYAIDFSPCSDVRANFGHVTKLTGKVAEAFRDDQAKCQTSAPRPEDSYQYCRQDLRLKLSAGEVIGEAGGGTATGLDWQVVDYRTPPLAYANPKRYRSDALHFACPLDLFDPTTGAELMAKLGGYDGQPRLIEPRCGAVNQDLPGTAQGNWFTGGPGILADSPETWGSGLALVHDNAKPTIGVAAVGGVIGPPQKIQFRPEASGEFNREFSTITPSQTIYCFENEIIGHNASTSPPRLLLQLTSTDQLMVELQSAICRAPIAFVSPITYER